MRAKGEGKARKDDDKNEKIIESGRRNEGIEDKKKWRRKDE